MNVVASKQNMRIWGNQRPMEHIPTVLNSPGVMNWCVISDKSVIGSFFQYDNVSRELYERILIKYAFTQFLSLKEDLTFNKTVLLHSLNRARNI